MQTELVKIIRQEIRGDGPISFSRYMQHALYHPEHGYYGSGRANIGRGGDYFTNVSVGPLFGRLLAAQFADIWERLGKIDDFTIVEQGAHDGQFASDVLSALRERSPEMFDALRYRIVEPVPILQERQTNVLADYVTKISWTTSLADLDPFAGVHFSNELLDAMPIDLRGKSVGLDGERFVLVENSETCAPNHAQLDWIDAIASKLQRGFVVTADYGFVRTQFREVVQARAKHRLLDSPFEQIGEADISVHVNWTDIAERAQERGFQIAGFTDQHHFFTGIIAGIGRGGSPEPSVGLARVTGDWGQSPLAVGAKEARQLQTLLHPEMLGRVFQVLALAKNTDLSKPLAGFRFARESRATLELKL